MCITKGGSMGRIKVVNMARRLSGKRIMASSYSDMWHVSITSLCVLSIWRSTMQISPRQTNCVASRARVAASESDSPADKRSRVAKQTSAQVTCKPRIPFGQLHERHVVMMIYVYIYICSYVYIYICVVFIWLLYIHWSMYIYVNILQYHAYIYIHKMYDCKLWNK